MSKDTADDCKKIEIWWLLRDIKERGGFKYTTVGWGENGSHGKVGVQVSIQDEEKYVRFIYTQTDRYTGEKKDFDYKVPLVTTPCHFGGERFWYECSLTKDGKYCGRRVGVLYKSGDWFGCRHCYELTYSSRNVNRRSDLYSLFRVLELNKKADDLNEKAVRYSYNGKLTKKQMRIMELQSQAGVGFRRYMTVEKGRKMRGENV
ncbi:hypothetical protein GW937_00055 [Candidatus Kaiserbacteria bacterium]|nr:hypothetical protein [Candidatus Kaiserbacteria bacterium]